MDLARALTGALPSRGACRALLLGLLLATLPSLAQAQTPPAPAPLEPAAMLKLLQTIDERTRSPGDYRAVFYVEQKTKGKLTVMREGLVYRRDADQKLMILVTKPKVEQGKGYLRLEQNLWLYDPSVGKWERKTERERIAGTDSRRTDFDQSRLAEEYEPTFEGVEKLGAFSVYRLSLSARPGVEVASPKVQLWIDVSTGNVLKRQEFALSGRLMRTEYFPKWQKLFSETKKGDIWFPREVRIFDELEKANSTLVLFQTVDLKPLPENLFTKGWLEGQLR